MSSLERAIAPLPAPRRGNGRAPSTPGPPPPFAPSVELRLGNLERDVGDLKGRINGLIFVVLGAVITQVVLRVMA